MNNGTNKPGLGAGELVRIIHPNSLKRMNVVGIVTEVVENIWVNIWVPDIGREIFFLNDQVEKVL